MNEFIIWAVATLISMLLTLGCGIVARNAIEKKEHRTAVIYSLIALALTICAFVSGVMCISAMFNSTSSETQSTITVDGHTYERIDETEEPLEEIVVDGVTYRLVEET